MPNILNVNGGTIVPSILGTEVLYFAQQGTDAIGTVNQIAAYANSVGRKSLNAASFGCSPSNSDNAATLQAAINQAVSLKVPLYLPAGIYKYTAPLTVSGNLSIYGDYVQENWSGGINVPQGNPLLSGSVLAPSSNGANGITISGTSLNVEIENIGISFQTPYVGTGDGINYTPPTVSGGFAQGLSGSLWKSVKIIGHDGNHYAVNLTNPIYCTFINLFGYGGGGLSLFGGGAGDYGNSVFIHPYFQVYVGGTAYGYKLTGAGLLNSNLNLLTFIRPQAIINSQGGQYSPPSPVNPTNAQYVFYQDANTKAVRLISPDFESTVSAPCLLQANGGNTYDFEATLNAGADVVVTLNGQPVKQAILPASQRIEGGFFTGLTSGVLIFDEAFPSANVSTVISNNSSASPLLAGGAPDTPYTITASISGTTITVTATTGTIAAGDYLQVPGSGFGYPLAFGTGSGGAGTYTTLFAPGNSGSQTYQVFKPNGGEFVSRYGFAYTQPSIAQINYISMGY